MGASDLALGISAGAVAGVVTVPVALAAARRFALLDVPDGGLKLHQGSIPRTGGWILLAAIAAGLLCAALRFGTAASVLTPYLVGAAAAFATGLLDDRRPLPQLVKLLGLLLAASSVVALGGGCALFGDRRLDALVTIFCLVGGANAWNLIDGLDALAGGLLLIAAVALGLLALQSGEPIAGLLMAALLGGGAVFLWHNRPPARLFLGDAGSLAAGFLLTGIVLHLARGSGAPQRFAAGLLVMSVPILETAATIIRRAVRRRSPLMGDRDHTYDLLTRRWGSRRAVATLLLVGAAAGLAAQFYPRIAGTLPPLILAPAAALAALALAAWGLRRPSRPKRREAITGGVS